MTPCLSLPPRVAAEVSSVYKSRLLRSVNWVFAACYLYAIAHLLLTWIHESPSLIGTSTLTLVFLLLAFGHLRLKLWASQVTASLLVVATIFSSFILPGGFEPEVLPSFQSRIFLVSSIATIASIAVANYMLCKREEQRPKSAG